MGEYDCYRIEGVIDVLLPILCTYCKHKHKKGDEEPCNKCASTVLLKFEYDENFEFNESIE